MRPERPSNPGEGEEEREAARPPGHLDADLPILDPEDDDDDIDDIDDEDDDIEDDDIEDDEALAGVIEEEPRTVLITGACGNIGRKLRDAWIDVYDLVLIDRVDEDDPDVIVANLAVLDDDWITHFHGVDTVVHLAANPDAEASWDDLVGPNLDVLANVLNAAALAGVERVVFASSNHVMGGYRDLDEEPITIDREPLPDGPYGAAKLFGERLGRSLSRAFDLTFIALRIGWVQEGANRADSLPDDWSPPAPGCPTADLVRLFGNARRGRDRGPLLRRHRPERQLSRNRGMRWDLSDAAELLGYLPVDDAFATHAAIEEPEESTRNNPGQAREWSGKARELWQGADSLQSRRNVMPHQGHWSRPRPDVDPLAQDRTGRAGSSAVAITWWTCSRAWTTPGPGTRPRGASPRIGTGSSTATRRRSTGPPARSIAS